MDAEEKFSEDFINYLFELVEETRSNPDETLNYTLIKLIVGMTSLQLQMLPDLRPFLIGRAKRTVHGRRDPAALQTVSNPYAWP